MRQKSLVPALLGGLGGALAAVALTICLTQRDAEPIILGYPQGAEDCVSAMMAELCSGNYSGASQYLYGQPDLGSGASADSEAAMQLWNSFTSSLHYTADAPCTASDSGVCQQVTITGLDMNRVLEDMAAEAPELLERKIALSDSMDDVYDENHEYRPGFVDSVLYQAANLALELNKDGELMEIGGIRVYRSSNMEKNRFVWIDGMTICSLTTTCNAKDAEAVVSTFGEQ